mgnify:FL=1
MHTVDLSGVSTAKDVAEAFAAMGKKKKEEQHQRAIMEQQSRSTVAQEALLREQIDLLYEQNRVLSENNQKLKDMYEAQLQAAEEARAELEKSHIYNWVMLGVTVFSAGVTVIGLFY